MEVHNGEGEGIPGREVGMSKGPQAERYRPLRQQDGVETWAPGAEIDHLVQSSTCTMKFNFYF